jgi:hypothetical protein
VAEEASAAALDGTQSVEDTGALTIPTERSSVTEATEEMRGEVASPAGPEERSEVASPAAPGEVAEEAPPEPVEEAPAEPVEEAPPDVDEEAMEVQAPVEVAPAAEGAPAAPPQLEPDHTEPPHAPLEPLVAPPEPSTGEPTPAEPPPVGSPPGEPSPPPAPTFLGRRQIRRRASYLRRLREVQLRDIGGFMAELYRFERDRPDLLQAKLEEARSTESELRALERALGEEQAIAELRQAGIGGACSNCGAVYGSADRYCASCGNPLSRRA